MKGGRVLIAGGGTGGHLFPGVAVAREMLRHRSQMELAFVSAGRALESRILADAGLALLTLPARPVRGQNLWGRLKALAALPGAVLAALRLIKRFGPGLVLAVGGYAAFPLGVAAWLRRVPLAVQEQNAAPGLTNRFLGKLARVVFAAYSSVQGFYPAGRVRLTGNPVRMDLLEQAAATMRLETTERFTVLVLGGSQGAHSLNQALVAALPLLAPRRGVLHFIHQTGSQDEAWVRAAYAKEEFSAEVAAFFVDMGRCYGLAHLVFCRAGASTISEVSALARASVLVPYPYAAGDHQTRNAQELMLAGAAWMISDAELNGEAAANAIADMMDQPEQRRSMEEAAGELARPHAAEDIAARCLAMIKEAA